MKLNDDNYYSQEANWEYMSVSQYKDFAGSYGRLGCEAQAMAKLRGEFEPEKSTALLVGSYVDSYFEGPESFARFKAENPEIFKNDGGLRAEYIKADAIIKRIERDDLFMTCMSGEKQVIMTGDLFGTKWKIKMDSYHPDLAIVDLKIVKSINEHKYVHDIGQINFAEYWGYDVQGAIYQEIVYQNTGKRLPFWIAAATKETDTMIEVGAFKQSELDAALSKVEFNIGRILDVKFGRAEPERCGLCKYCKETKVLTGPIWLDDIPTAV